MFTTENLALRLRRAMIHRMVVIGCYLMEKAKEVGSLVFSIRSTDAEVLLPAEINLSKNQGVISDSCAILSLMYPLHFCPVLQSSGASLICCGERY